jgi:hypothetical protein
VLVALTAACIALGVTAFVNWPWWARLVIGLLAVGGCFVRRLPSLPFEAPPGAAGRIGICLGMIYLPYGVVAIGAITSGQPELVLAWPVLPGAAAMLLTLGPARTLPHGMTLPTFFLIAAIVTLVINLTIIVLAGKSWKLAGAVMATIVVVYFVVLMLGATA